MKEIAGYLAENPMKVVGEADLRKKFPNVSRATLYRHIKQLLRNGEIRHEDGWRIASFLASVKYSKEGQEISESIDRSRTIPLLPSKPEPGEPDFSKFYRFPKRYFKNPRKIRYPPDWDEMITREAPDLMAKVYTMRAIATAVKPDELGRSRLLYVLSLL